MKCNFFTSRQKLIFCHELKKIQENKKIGIHPKSRTVLLLLLLVAKYKCGILVTRCWSLEQVRDSCYEVLEQVRDSGHWVLGRNSGEKSSVPIFLLSQFYHFTYHYIIRYQNKKQDNKNKTS